MRKYKAYAIRRNESVGIGIEEYNDTTTLSIASIYLPYRPSHKELFDVLARHVVDQLQGDQVALLRVTIPIRTKYQWTICYNWRLFVQDEPTAHMPFIQTMKLAEDALERQATIN